MAKGKISKNTEALSKAVMDAQKALNDYIGKFENDFINAVEATTLSMEDFNNLKNNILPSGRNKLYILSVETYRRHWNDGDADDFDVPSSPYNGDKEKTNDIYGISGKNFNLTMALFKHYLDTEIAFNKSYNSYTGYVTNFRRIDSVKLLGSVPFTCTTEKSALDHLGIPESLYEALGISHYWSNYKLELMTDESLLKRINESRSPAIFYRGIKVENYDPYDFEAKLIQDGKLNIKRGALKARVKDALKAAGLSESHLIYEDEAPLLAKNFKSNIKKVIEACKEFDSYDAKYIRHLQTYFSGGSDRYVLYRPSINESSKCKFKLIDYNDTRKDYISSAGTEIYKIGTDIEDVRYGYSGGSYLLTGYNIEAAICEDVFMCTGNIIPYNNYKTCPLIDAVTIDSKLKIELKETAEIPDRLRNIFNNRYKHYDWSEYTLERLKSSKKSAYMITKYLCKPGWYESSWTEEITTWLKLANLHPVASEKLDGFNNIISRIIVEPNEPGETYDYSMSFDKLTGNFSKYKIPKRTEVYGLKS